MNYCYRKNLLEWAEFPEYDMLWTDPPWEEKMVKFFRTQMKKDFGSSDDFNITEILEHLAKLADKTKPLFVEYSVKGHERVIDIMKAFGHTHKMTCTQIQSTKLPYIIMVFNTDYKLPLGLKGFDSVKHAVNVLKPSRVFDPFAGIGLTAKAVISQGSFYIGSEINPKRFKRLETIVEKANDKLQSRI
tara:strand:+ start:970 stop:1533 length:564 start_codon:yes stop_codon:yes gene_type:complete